MGVWLDLEKLFGIPSLAQVKYNGYITFSPEVPTLALYKDTAIKHLYFCFQIPRLYLTIMNQLILYKEKFSPYSVA